jgi:hypothetical protein
MLFSHGRKRELRVHTLFVVLLVCDYQLSTSTRNVRQPEPCGSERCHVLNLSSASTCVQLFGIRSALLDPLVNEPFHPSKQGGSKVLQWEHLSGGLRWQYCVIPTSDIEHKHT